MTTTFVYESTIWKIFGWSLIRETYQTPENQFSRLILVHHSAEEEIGNIVQTLYDWRGRQNWIRVVNLPLRPYHETALFIKNDDFAKGAEG
jgi:hypothetical protein